MTGTLSVLCTEAPAVEEQAAVRLTDWMIFELPGGARHFCGFHAGQAPGKGRVSTEIVRFDPDSLEGSTGSGRLYRLEGPPGEGPGTRLLRDAWLISHGLDPSIAGDVDPTAPVRGMN